MSRVSAGTSMKCNCGAEMKLRDGKYGKFWGCSTFPKCRQTRRYEKEAVVQEEHQSFEPSKYQKAVFEFIQNETGHLVVDAKAGSGKTWTDVEGIKYVPKNASVALVAFNRHIARTFAAKVPVGVTAVTLHSLGLGNITNALGNVEVEPRKVYWLVKDLMDELTFEEWEVVDQSMSSITRLVSLCKATLKDPTIENLAWMADRWGIETNGDRELIFQAVEKVYRRSVENDATIDYDDMIHMCATGKVPCKQFDFLFVDETQDLNAAQLEMAMRSIKPGGRIIAVGDPDQSIYGFRGADTEAMPNIIKRLDATVLPLSITYRCPKSHVALANTLVPELEAAEWAEEGTIEGISEYAFLDRVKVGDLVLCRTNAPLVKPAFSLIRQGTKAVILGRDIGKNLMSLVKKIQKRYRVARLDDTLAKLMEYERKERARLVRAGREMQAETLGDKVETIFALCDGCATVGDLERRVETVFADDSAGVTFSTVHKAKGAEADRVFILKPELMPHPMASQDWEVVQEYNIQYVAYTRAKKALYFVGAAPLFTTDGEGEPSPEVTPEIREMAEAAAEKAPPDSLQAIIKGDWLDQFPTEGKFEQNIYRPSAHDFVNAMPDWSYEIDAGQLVMTKALGKDSTAKVYTSIKTGQIAGGTGDDSIRVVRIDATQDGRTFAFKNAGQDWITRSVPQDCKTSEQATAHLVKKIEKQVAAFTKPCPDCGKTAVKCKRGKGRDTNYWWRCLECRWSTW